ncbi:hypothetical protein JCM8208_001746 [Rhodotorula glutinis]
MGRPAQKRKNAARKAEHVLRRQLGFLVGEIERKPRHDHWAAGEQDMDMASSSGGENDVAPPPNRLAADADTASSSQPVRPPPPTTASMSDADLALLRLDCSFEASLFDLDNLTPVQLAVAALRSDLDSLVQRRAYHEFIQRRDEYEQGFGTGTPEPIFAVPLNFPIPADIHSLGPAYLLLIQFNPLCLSGAEAAAAGVRFFELAREATSGAPKLPPTTLAPTSPTAVDPPVEAATLVSPASPPPVDRAADGPAPGPPEPPLVEIGLDRCIVATKGIGSNPQTSLVVCVERDGLTMLGSKGERLFKLEASSIADFAYYPPVPLDGDEPASPPTTIIGMKRLLLEPHKRKPFNRSIVRLESVRLCEPDAGFEILRSQIRAWSAEYGFEAWSSGDRPPDDAAIAARSKADIATATAATAPSGASAPPADLAPADLAPAPAQPQPSTLPRPTSPSASTGAEPVAPGSSTTASGAPAPPTDLVMDDLTPPPPAAIPHPPSPPVASTSAPAPIAPSPCVRSTSPDSASSSSSADPPLAERPSRSPSVVYAKLVAGRCVVVHKDGREDVLEGPLVVRQEASALVVVSREGSELRLEAAQMDEVDYIDMPTADGSSSWTTVAVSLAELVTSSSGTVRSVIVRLEIDSARDEEEWQSLCEAVTMWAGRFGFEIKENGHNDDDTPSPSPAPVELPSADLAPPPLPADPHAPTAPVASTSAPVVVPPSSPARPTDPGPAPASTSVDPPPTSRPSPSQPSSSRVELPVVRCVVVHKDGREDVKKGPLVVRQEESALVVVPKEGSELRLEAAQIDEVDYIDPPTPYGPPSRTTVAVSLAELATSTSITVRSVVVRLEIDSARDEGAWNGLCEAVMLWAGRFGFETKENGNDDGSASPAALAPVELPSAALPAASRPSSSATFPPPPPPQPQPPTLSRPPSSVAAAAPAPFVSRLPPALPARPPKGLTPPTPAPGDVSFSRMSRPRSPSPARPLAATSRPPPSSRESGTPPLRYGRRGPAPSLVPLKRSPSPPLRRDPPPPPRRRSPSPHRRRPDPAPDRRRSRSPVRRRDSFDSPPRRPPPPPRRSPSPHRRHYSPPDRRPYPPHDRRRSRSPVPRRDPFDSPPPRRERSPPPRRRERSPDDVRRYAPRRTPSPGRDGGEPRWSRRERSPLPARRQSGYPPSPERGRSSAGSAPDERYAPSSFEAKWWTR